MVWGSSSSSVSISLFCLVGCSFCECRELVSDVFVDSGVCLEFVGLFSSIRSTNLSSDAKTQRFCGGA